MEFKGTKEKWFLSKHKTKVLSNIDPYVRTISPICFVAEIPMDRTKREANALLISKAPELLEMLNESMGVIRRLRLSMQVHPNCTEGCEFDDYINLAQETEDEIEQLIKESTDVWMRERLLGNYR